MGENYCLSLGPEEESHTGSETLGWVAETIDKLQLFGLLLIVQTRAHQVEIILYVHSRLIHPESCRDKSWPAHV